VCGSGDRKYSYRFDGALWREDDNCVALRRELSTTVREKFTAALHRMIIANIEYKYLKWN
jgi:hypothetical protein